MSRDVHFWFDLVSPYSYLALTQAESFAAEHGVNWAIRPVLYGAILDATGLVGPAEQETKRAYTARDIVRCADRLGVPLIGPPEHPFNPIPALRALCLYQDDEGALQLALGFATTCWAEGRSITDVEGISAALDEAGFDPGDDLAARISAPGIKAALRSNTDEAIRAGVFGVPTFGWRGELFWGHDRLPHLADRLTESLPDPEERAASWVRRPRGADRPGSPWRAKS